MDLKFKQESVQDSNTGRQRRKVIFEDEQDIDQGDSDEDDSESEDENEEEEEAEESESDQEDNEDTNEEKEVTKPETTDKTGIKAKLSEALKSIGNVKSSSKIEASEETSED